MRNALLVLPLLILLFTGSCSLTPGNGNNSGGGGTSSSQGSGLAMTPQMGWNSWNVFGGNINEVNIKQIADTIAADGLKRAGYTYVNLDDNWMASSRDANGNLQADPTRFPDGITALATYVHNDGLKFGIYGDHGFTTCMGVPQSGGYGNYQRDANTYASWGVDYLKYDNCNLPAGDNLSNDYTQMAQALINSGRPILFSICAWAFYPWEPAIGNSWRTTGDINDSWSSVLNNIYGNAELSSYAKPGHWNDPDMLEVGNGGLSDDESWSHFAMWCIMAAPLIIGNDVRSMTTNTLGILTNTLAISIDQDPAGIQGTVVDGNFQIWVKPLGSSNGNMKAVALLNTGSAPADITVLWNQIGLSSSGALVVDCRSGAVLGTFSTGYTGNNIPSHGTLLLIVTATSSGSGF